VADLAMMFALFGAVVALHHLSNNGKIPANAGGDNTDDPVQGSSNSALAFKPSKGIVLGSSILAALVISVAVISAFVSWDIRRTTASRARVVAVSDESEMVRALGWVDTQARTPERSSYTNPLFIEYFNAAINQRKLGNEEGSSALMMESRNLLLDFEKYDPFKRDAQINLFRTAVTLTTWGESDYEQETVDRAIKIVDLYPTYPSVAATLASDMASIGQYDLAIEFADKAIATEETTQPWASAWFAKGQALHELGRTDEAIEILSVATVKDPESAGSILSHRLLAEIYEARGDTERAELHKEQGEG
jgi:tetratricopeptide (TPR) repeat protein